MCCQCFYSATMKNSKLGYCAIECSVYRLRKVLLLVSGEEINCFLKVKVETDIAIYECRPRLLIIATGENLTMCFVLGPDYMSLAGPVSRAGLSLPGSRHVC